MAKHMLKGFVVAGLLGVTGLAVGCQDNREGVINDGEGPLEQNEAEGTFLEDGKGPIENNTDKKY